MINKYQTTIKPNLETKWQNHLETEVIVILKGRGIVYSEEEKEIKEGDVIILPSFKSHLIKNVGSEDLIFAGIYWNESPKHETLSQEKEVINLILPSFTTPNGRMHLGHLGGPVLLADIFKRAQIVLGFENSYQLTGSIGFQTHVGVTARKLGLSYNETALKFSNDFKENYKSFNIDFDEFISLERYNLYKDICIKFISYLKDSGYLILKEKMAPFCVGCNKFLFEAGVFGTCPHCASSVSAECENCAVFIADDEILEPKCYNCNQDAVFKPLKRLFLPLAPHRGKIQNLLMRGCFMGNSASDVEKFLSNKLPEVPISIYADNGIEMPNFDGQKIYSAIELLPRFLTAFEVLNSGRNFPQDANFRLNLFFGKDNNYLRCIIFPILLSIYKPEITCDLFFSNEFWQLKGAKFSTSRQNVFYLEEAMKEIDADWLRFYLTSRDISVKECNFDITNAKTLFTNYYNKLQSIVAKINFAIKEQFVFKVPEAGIWERRHIYFYELLQDLERQAKKCFSKESFNPSKINAIGRSLMEELYEFSFLLEVKHANPNVFRTVMALNLLGLKLLSTILTPIMPTISMCISDNLNTIPSLENLTFLEPNIKINQIIL